MSDEGLTRPEGGSLDMQASRSVGKAIGGYARASVLPPERRREIAQAAARSRWGNAEVVTTVAATLGTCRRGHSYSLSKAGGRVCLTCRTEAVRRWKRDNPDRVRAVARAWRERNREKIAAAHAAWRAKHRDRLLVYWREQSRARRKAARG